MMVQHHLRNNLFRRGKRTLPPFCGFGSSKFQPCLNVADWATFSFDVNAFYDATDVAGLGDGQGCSLRLDRCDFQIGDWMLYIKTCKRRAIPNFYNDAPPRDLLALRLAGKGF